MVRPPLSKRPPWDLETALASTLSDAPQVSAVHHLVARCQRLALAYLLSKAQRGALHLKLLGMPADSLALDCIAELFRRDDEGHFTELRGFFGEASPSGSTEEDLQIALRQLVFSKVNENLFRRYREADPNLAKIIRNLKDAVSANPRLRFELCGGRSWVVVLPSGSAGPRPALTLLGPGSSGERPPGAHDGAPALPLVPPEVLTASLAGNLNHIHRVRDLAVMFVEFVEQHPHYASRYPLMGLAAAIRDAFACVAEREEESAETPDTLFSAEVEAAIQAVTRRIEAEKWPWYVGGGRVEAATYAAYFAAVRSQLTELYVRGDGATSNFAALSLHLLGLEEQAYRDEHRNVVEYLMKLARERLLQHFQVDA